MSNHSRCNIDVEYVTLNFNLVNVKEIYVVGVYRGSSGNINEFINIMDNIIDTVSDNVNIETDFIGDININVTKPRHIMTRKYSYFLKHNHLYNVINEPIRFSHITCRHSLLDNVSIIVY